MPQTSVSNPADIGVEGQLSGVGQVDKYHARNDESSARIPFGRMIAKGAAQDEALLCSTLTDKLLGVSVFGQAYAKESELDADGFKPGTTFDYLTKGRIYVRVEDAVTPASEVHVRMKAGAGDAALVVPDFTFTAEADDETLTKVGHGLETGDGPFQMSNSGGALPTGLSAATNYWVIYESATKIALATSLANALAGTAIDITADGTGTQTMSDTVDTEQLTTLNLSKFAKWRSSAGIGEIAELEINMVNSDLATLG